jgi:hypothetical protein
MIDFATSTETNAASAWLTIKAAMHLITPSQLAEALRPDITAMDLPVEQKLGALEIIDELSAQPNIEGVWQAILQAPLYAGFPRLSDVLTPLSGNQRAGLFLLLISKLRAVLQARVDELQQLLDWTPAVPPEPDPEPEPEQLPDIGA